MKAKVNLLRSLVVLAVGLLMAMAVALIGADLKRAESQATTPKFQVQDLGTLGGSSSTATGINASGQVVGVSDTSDGAQHAFLYDEGATPEGATPKMQDLETLGGNESRAAGISASGQVVGHSYTSEGAQHAFLYDGTNGMQDLNDLIPAGFGWTITSASAFNADGKIAATGYKDGVGMHALLLTPTSSDIRASSPPTITSPRNNSYDKDGSFSVSGSAEAASTVALFEGTISRGTANADPSSGAWSIALSGVSEGSHTYAAKATDAAGNTSSASNPVTVTVDKTPPKVSKVSPAHGATKVARNTSVMATFSEAIDPKTLVTTPEAPSNPNVGTSTTFTLAKNGTTALIGATVSYDDTTNKVTLTPSSNLDARTKYTAKLSGGVKDLAGNALANAPYTWSFTTGSN